MSGFANPIVGGGGALVYPSIHSPNFNIANPPASPAQSWALLKNGLAYLFGVVLTGGTLTGPDYIINTSGIFIYSGAPATGNLIGSWAGAAGTDAFGNAYPQGFNITKGAISGSTFTGTDFIINTTGAFFYAGAPAAGNLAASVVPGTTTVTDPHGNVAMAGLTAYQTPIALNSIATNVTAGVVQWAAWNGIGWGLGAGVDWTVPNGFLEVVNAPFRSIGGTRAAPTVISTDGWTTFGAFGAGFGAGGIAPQQCLMPAGPGGKGRVALRGQVLSTAATAANSTMVTAIGGPTQNMAWVVPTNANGYAPAAGSLPRVVLVDTAGNVRLQPSTSAANQFVLLDGIEWALG